MLKHPKTWEAYGHTSNFSDPFVKGSSCEKYFRLDKIWDEIWGGHWFASLKKVMMGDKDSSLLLRWAKKEGRKLAPNLALVKEPEVVLGGKPVLEIEGIMKFLEDHGYEWPELQDKLDGMMSLGDDDGEWLVELAGRNCYQSWAKTGEKPKGRSHEKHIKHLIEIGHGSCLEHANFNFLMWNVSRSLTHELVRHRLASYSQLSQRYVDLSSVSFVVPPALQVLG